MPQEHVLITGATGLLGGAVLFDALQSQPEIAWTALVRAGTEGQGRARIAARLARFGGTVAAIRLAERVRVIPGDIFALRDADAAALSGITRVLHLAADTSYWSREGNWRVNFDGTLSLAAAAMHMPRLERFLHVGTATICGRRPPSVVHEDDFPRAGVEHIVHYTQAKASTETVLAERFPQLPLVIARPSIVAGHSTLGARPSASIFWFVRCAKELNLVTCDPAAGIDIVPSDWTAAALLHLLLKPALAHRTYHLSAGTGSRCHWPSLARAHAAATGTPVTYPERFDPRDLARLRARFDACFGRRDARLALMLKAARKYYEFCALDVTFDNARLLAEGMAAPPSLPDYLDVCLANPAGQSVLDAFLDDADMFDPAAAVTAAAA